jgi:diguanylate cyclase (GGDEF)-like protein/PAS domain S-box-containing protein
VKAPVLRLSLSHRTESTGADPAREISWQALLSYGLLGALVGTFIPLGAILALLARDVAPNVILLHRAQPLLYIVETIPFFFGICAAVAGFFRNRALHIQAVIDTDLSARREAEDARQRSETRFRAIFDNAAIGIVLLDNDGYFIESNVAFQELLGYSREELRLMRASDLSPIEDAEITRGPIRELKAGHCHVISVEKRFICKDGTVLLCALQTSRVAGADGHVGFVGMLQDITKRRKMETDLAYQAWYDVLTGLANRSRLIERTAVALEQAASPEKIVLLFVDLDGFKSVNDSLGHSYGDELLKNVAARILDATRGSDTVARLGGDEFAVLLHNAQSRSDAMTTARRVLNAVGQPLSLEGQEISISASIGVAHGDEGDTAEMLVRNADLAMYRAKLAGRSRIEAFAPEMHAIVHERLAFESDLRKALELNQFSLAYQPIFEITTGRITGAEALLRWTHPIRGAVPPSDFIPVAERIGLIAALGRWTLRTACAQGAQWIAARQALHPKGEHRVADSRHSAQPPFYLSVNVSSRQLQDATIVADVARALAATKFDPHCLVLEITESVIMHDVEETLPRLHELKSLGLRLAVDDFGTGYSSLSYLQRLPIDVMKVDRSFVRGIGASGHSESLVRTVLALGDMLGMQCVAEGVETLAQHDFLASLGCAHGQGFRYGRPVAADAFQQAWVPNGFAQPSDTTLSLPNDMPSSLSNDVTGTLSSPSTFESSRSRASSWRCI